MERFMRICPLLVMITLKVFKVMYEDGSRCGGGVELGADGINATRHRRRPAAEHSNTRSLVSEGKKSTRIRYFGPLL